MSIFQNKEGEFDLERIKEYIKKKIDWDSISDDWKINYQPRYSAEFQIINLNPKQNCSKNNPLYTNKKWLEHLYINLELSERKIAKICGVDKSTIGRWLIKHEIPKRIGTGRWIEKRSGHVLLYMPKDYNHPKLKPLDRGEGRFVRPEHVVVMEKYLSEHPELEISKKYLIDGKYLRIGCIVHHINFIPQDNRIENLWIFENTSEHQITEQSLFECFSVLIKLNQILFENGKYYLNKKFDCRKLNLSKIQEKLESKKGYIQYKNINEVKEAIKEFDWFEISDNWTVKYRQNQFMEYVDIQLNPSQDCSDDNQLYRHKIWLETIVLDGRFNLTDSRLGKLCGISKDKAKGWRRRHNIKKGRNWGFKRFINKEGRVWVKVPDGYNNPTALANRGYMLEHRYIVERRLVKHRGTRNLKEYLVEDKYLRSKIKIHHINLDPSDNRLENFYICKSESEHKKIEYSLYKLTDKLLRSKFIFFKKGKYFVFYL